jgi:hypothetical protein
MKKRTSAPANVRALDALTPRPHPDRIASIRHWHIEQAASDPPMVAAIYIAVSADLQVRTSAVAVEPEHAQIILGALDAVTTRLADMTADASRCAQIIPIDRR